MLTDKFMPLYNGKSACKQNVIEDRMRGRMRKETNKKIRHLCCMAVLFLLLLISGTVSAGVETQVKVNFYDKNGTALSNLYGKTNLAVKKGTVIELPSPQEIKGYVNAGWTTAKGKTTPLYTFGSKYTVNQDTKFYLVQKKIYMIYFASSDGTINSSFQKLKVELPEGQSIILPTPEEREDYSFMGWSKSKNSSKVDYKAGTVLKPTANMILYAVYAKNVTLKYLSNDGKTVYKSVTVGKGTVVKLSGKVNNSGCTFLGWAAKSGVSVSPTYLVGQNLTVNANTKLYAVQYKKKQEYNYTASTLPKINTSKYTKVIFVGDSRTYRMKQTLENQFSADKLKGVTFVAKGGAALSWFAQTGYNSLIKAVGNGGTAKKTIAVVFNLGVNDLQDLSEYISRMKKIEPILKKKNCRLFYMSVNPVNNLILVKNGSKNRPESTLMNFNKKIQSELCVRTSFTYIDSFTYLMKNGFSFDNGRGTDTGIEDGIHYSTKTYKKIYAYVIDTLNKL